MSSPISNAIAIIPARGGSKRIPRKNIRSFRGQPLLQRTVSTLLSATLFDRVIVSTEDPEIAQVAESCGAEVPFRRPSELADDFTGARPVIVDAIEALDRLGSNLEGTAICIVYPAAVLCQPEDFSASHAVFVSGDLDFLFSATRFAAPVQRAMRMLPDGTAEMLLPDFLNTRSQDLEPAFHDAGLFYWGYRASWLSGTPVFQARSGMHVMQHWRVQDIDTVEDWMRAEFLHSYLESR